MLRSTNPVMNEKTLQASRSYGIGETMTIQGAVNKTFVLLGLIVFSASWIWSKIMQSPPVSGWGETTTAVPSWVGPTIMVGFLGGFIMALVTVFNKQWSGVTSPIYAILEGLALGGVSAFFEQSYPGIVINAVALTIGTMFCMLIAYQTKMIRVTEKFMLGLVAATGAICFVYLASWIFSFFGIYMPFIHSSGIAGIGFSLVVVVIAALNLVLDFHLMEKSAAYGMPKYMEWYCAFGLMVTLVWLYIEILHLLAKLRDRR